MFCKEMAVGRKSYSRVNVRRDTPVRESIFSNLLKGQTEKIVVTGCF